jgi:hypothetical protein
MIPRHQTILFIILLVTSIIMGVVLWQLRNRAHERLLAGQDSAPTQAPQVAPVVQATLLVANDQENTIVPQTLTLPLSASPNARAQAILGKLLDLYAAPNATHSVPGGAAGIKQVFLMPANSAAKNSPAGGELAIVNLSANFATGHPSGLEAETLTVLSICATLHANLPGITEVRFLVDGQPRPTLAGHADLTRTYLTADAIPTEGIHP